MAPAQILLWLFNVMLKVYYDPVSRQIYGIFLGVVGSSVCHIAKDMLSEGLVAVCSVLLMKVVIDRQSQTTIVAGGL